MLKKYQREQEKEQQRIIEMNQKAAQLGFGLPTMPLCPADAGGGGGSGLTDPLLSLIGAANDHSLIQAASTVDFDVDLVSLLDASEETSAPKLSPRVPTETNLIDPTQISNTRPEQIQLQPGPSAAPSPPCVPLPEGLTPALEDSIRKLLAVRSHFLMCVCRHYKIQYEAMC